MNKIFLLFVAMISTVFSTGQPKGSIVELTYAFENLAAGEKRTVTLLVRNQESLTTFSMKDTLRSGGEPKDFDFGGEDATGRQVYKNSLSGEVIFRDFMPVDGAFQPCIVADPMKPMSWTFLAETKLIGRYTCKVATTSFRGRSYVAWYTEDIPVTHGPWKFSGLPGAIVEVHSTDRSHSFALTLLSTRREAEIKPPSGGQTVTMREYVKRKEQAISDFINRLTAALPRGAEISAVTTGDNNLETDFSDVKK